MFSIRIYRYRTKGNAAQMLNTVNYIHFFSKKKIKLQQKKGQMNRIKN